MLLWYQDVRVSVSPNTCWKKIKEVGKKCGHKLITGSSSTSIQSSFFFVINFWKRPVHINVILVLSDHRWNEDILTEFHMNPNKRKLAHVKTNEEDEDVVLPSNTTLPKQSLSLKFYNQNCVFIHCFTHQSTSVFLCVKTYILRFRLQRGRELSGSLRQYCLAPSTVLTRYSSLSIASKSVKNISRSTGLSCFCSVL